MVLPPPGERLQMLHHHKFIGHHRLLNRGTNPTLSPEDTQDSGKHFINVKNMGQVEA